MNLLHNSWLHGFEQGKHSGTITLKARAENNLVTIDHSDNGKGIPPEICDQAFERFFTTAAAQGGSGIGLHNCLRLVQEQLGGAINCDKEAKQGARFVLQLPQIMEPEGSALH